MVAKMIDELEIADISFCASYAVIMESDTKKKSNRKIWTREWLLKRNERGAYNGILNDLLFYLKKRLWHRCFPVNFVKFNRTPFFLEHLSWLLVNEVQLLK